MPISEPTKRITDFVFIDETDTALASANIERTEMTMAWVKHKEIRLMLKGDVIRSFFELKNMSSVVCYGRVYKNGVAYGIERSTTSSDYVSFTEDLAYGIEDLFQLYIKGNTQFSSVTNTRNFQARGKVEPYNWSSVYEVILD